MLDVESDLPIMGCTYSTVTSKKETMLCFQIYNFQREIIKMKVLSIDKKMKTKESIPKRDGIRP